MKQIDQDPGGYRVQASDGSWQHRVNKPLCRWLGFVGLGVSAYFTIGSGGDTAMVALFVGAMCFAAGGLITLSLKSPNL